MPPASTMPNTRIRIGFDQAPIVPALSRNWQEQIVPLWGAAQNWLKFDASGTDKYSERDATVK
ncbi:hypothetical protein SBA3_1160011 [Candidatus Sulfopaludibacter sp. SbA3]|nr:hypothetical protein SBA3_1160011 [Candidatus Sulfopaludibacter sp. SbA3]